MLVFLHQTIQRYRKDTRGVAYIEMAFVLMFLMLLFVGVVELVSYMKVKERMNKVADEMSGLLANIPSWNVGTNVTPAIVASQSMATPYGVSVSARFCRGGAPQFDSGAFDAQYAGADGRYGVGNCNHSTNIPGAALTAVNCNDAQMGGNGPLMTTNPTVQFVVVRAGCRYSAPLLGTLGLFNNAMIVTTSVSPMRYTMTW